MFLALPFHTIDPVFLQIGPIQFRWYGLMYAIGFLCCYLYIRRRINQGKTPITPTQLSDLLLVVFLGVFLGGRLGYILFYNLSYYLSNPIEIFSVWEGGMSFHGGLIGVAIAILLYAKKQKIHPLTLADTIVTPIPIAIGLGRLGNFINGELFGKPTDLPWCMNFPAGGNVCRHPSQLYEFLGEGVLLFLILWYLEKKSTPRGTQLWILLIGYGVVRFLVEFVREPDAQLGLLAMELSMGQWLSLPLVIIGLIGLYLGHITKQKHA